MMHMGGRTASAQSLSLTSLFRLAIVLFQVLALIGLRAAKTLVQRNLDIIEANVAHFRAFCERHSKVMAFAAPDAGSIAFARLLTGEPIEAFCVRLVEEAGEDHLLYHGAACLTIHVTALLVSLIMWSPGSHLAGVCRTGGKLQARDEGTNDMQVFYYCQPLSMTTSRPSRMQASEWAWAGATCQSA